VNVVVETGGEYFLDNGVPQEIVIVRPGVYYREDSSLPPYVSSPTVGLTQLPPSNGTGAVILLQVDTDTSSATFGRIIDATIPQGQGGSGYHIRGGPRPGPFNTVPAYGMGVCAPASQISLVPSAAGFSMSFAGGLSSDGGLPIGLSGALANTRDGDTCADWFTNPLLPTANISAGKVQLSPGGRFSDWQECCHCPCNDSSGQDFRYLKGCGIQAIIVEVTVAVKDDNPNISNTCPAKTATFELSLANTFFELEEDDNWVIRASFACSGRLKVFVTANVNFPGNCETRLFGVLQGGIAGVFTLPANSQEDLRICCPEGGSFEFENIVYTLSASVTMVMA